MVDVTVQNEGTILLFHLNTEAAQEWVEHHVETESYQWFGPALVVEHRYADTLVAGMQNDGLEVE